MASLGSKELTHNSSYKLISILRAHKGTIILDKLGAVTLQNLASELV